MNRSIKNVSLFAGGGGIDLGFKWAGIETVLAVEITDYACSTIKRNSPETFVFGPPNYSGDVRDIDGPFIQNILGPEIEIDVLSGGPPCQPFSIASGQRWGKDDPRYKRNGNERKDVGDLLPEYVRLVKELKPKVFLLENVEGLLKWNDGNYLTESLKPLLEEYKISTPQVINAADYGVPQHRQRLILIGTRIAKKTPVLPEKTNSENDLFYTAYNTVEDALDNFSDDLPNHTIRKHSSETVERYNKLNFGERDRLGRVDRLNPNLPSKTVISGGNRGGGRSHLHPYLPRTLSPRECARIQTFPDDYIFEGSIARQFTQVGNAVPPLLAYRLGRYIVEELLEEKNVKGFDMSTIKHPIISNLNLKSVKSHA